MSRWPAPSSNGSVNGRPTRFKDLVDLVAMVRYARPTATDQGEALRSEAVRPTLTLPAEFDVPDVGLWTAGYAAEARRALPLPAVTLTEALGIVRRYLNPVLDRTARGVWDPEHERWHD